ncbi:glycosyltransferase [Polymorphum gilvum]|uniref:Glycosyl transferase group 1 n=1 Tax=Polymorphum gilvum (strain LMG 25793 / CGMCC 1.9160 / SL003B-26A1) TaxID=991905 RepID=F2J5G4_POLGS|nr:glycosyltransferase [Polymorphum gilvum]ADZ72334.1 Glycosyl transferase group 1 [Polymorphum gilvum SL003B-26A1]
MRILMPCAAFPPVIDGGGPVSSLMLAKMLLAEGHDLRVVHVSDEDRHEVFDGVPVHRLRSLNLYWNYYTPRPAWQKMAWHLLENGNPRAFLAMRREIADFSPDIVLTVSIENVNVATWAAARAAGIPVAHTVFSAFMMCWNGVMQKRGENCAGQCTSCKVTSFGRRQFSRLVDTVIGESHDILRRHVDEGYFPNAVARRVPAAIDAIHATTPRAFPRGRPFRVGFLGVHTRFKGFGTLARAAGMLSPDADVEFLVGGTGRDAFAEEARALFPPERTTFLGWTTPESFFPQVDVLVYPTIGREAFGRATIEAFSYGVPVIASSIGGVAENVEAGVNGYHVAPDDAEALRARIEAMAGDPQDYERLSRGALDAARGYLRPHVGRLLSGVLEETLARRNAAGTPLAAEAAQ